MPRAPAIRSPATRPPANRSACARADAHAPAVVRQVFLFAGQSNMSAYSAMVLRGVGLTSNPGSPGTPPDYVPSYMQTAANEWSGVAPASVDTGTQYPYPTLANSPCVYNENTRGADAASMFDARGAFVKYFPQFNSSGALGYGGSFGPELSFLQRHLAAYPGVPIGAAKVSFGGTALRGDWLPDTVSMGTLQAQSGSTITLSTTDPGTSNSYGGAVVQMLSGAASGQERTVAGYVPATQIATLASPFSPPPTAGDSYGVQRLAFGSLRAMIVQESRAYDANDGPGNWRWAGLVWMQGESGAHADLSGGDSQYLSDSRAFYARVRSLTRANLPVVIGRIGDNWTKDNAYLAGLGYPYGAIDYSITGDGHTAGLQATRDTFNAGAYTRRATQATLGSDPNCAMYSNDGYSTVPYVNQNNYYHFSQTGNLTQGERAFSAFQTVRN